MLLGTVEERESFFNGNRLALIRYVSDCLLEQDSSLVYVRNADPTNDKSWRLDDVSSVGWDWSNYDYWPFDSLAERLTKLDAVDPVCLYRSAAAGNGAKCAVIRYANGVVGRTTASVGANPEWRVDDPKRGYPRNGEMINFTSHQKEMMRWFLNAGNEAVFAMQDGRMLVRLRNSAHHYIDDGSPVVADNGVVAIVLNRLVVERLVEE